MKTTRQAKIWKNKIDWFNDGFATKIQITDQQDNEVVYVERIAVVKGDIALHLALGWNNEPFSEFFQLTHVPSGFPVGS